jgi:hypothetical protein
MTRRIVVAGLVAFLSGALPVPTGALPTCDASPTTVRALRDAIAARPQGAVICLSGRYEIAATLVPKPAQVFRGPASIIGVRGVDVGFDDVPDVVFRNLTMARFDERAIELEPGMRIVGGRYHHNGENALGGTLTGHGGVVIEGVEVDHNGSPAFLNHSASGIKIVNSNGSVVRDSYVHDNVGNGIWFDNECRNDLVEDNVVIGNGRRGIFYEVSPGPAVIRRNRVRANNQENIDRGSGIGVSSSANVTVVNNVVSRNKLYGMRAHEVPRGYSLANVVFRNNDLARGQRVFGCSNPGVTCVRNR